MYQEFNKKDCISSGGSWVNSLPNFDTVTDSFVIMYLLMIGNGWASTMFTVSDLRGVEL